MGNLDHIVGFGATTIDVLDYSIGIARSCINNITWNGGYQSTYTQVKGCKYSGRRWII